MSLKSFIAGPSSYSPFRTEGLQYIPPGSVEGGFTLVFLHAKGLHKESTVHLFRHAFEKERVSGGFRVRDVWFIGEFPPVRDSLR
jgi:hypothetical protein